MVKISTSISGFQASDNALLKVPQFVAKETRRALRAAGKHVVRRAKQLVPPPGYKGDKPGLKPLRDTIATEVKEGRKAMYAVIGPKHPAGAHGHLVEFGHVLPDGSKTTPVEFLEPASESTKAQQRRDMEKILSEIDKQIGRLLR